MNGLVSALVVALVVGACVGCSSDEGEGFDEGLSGAVLELAGDPVVARDVLAGEVSAEGVGIDFPDGGRVRWLLTESGADPESVGVLLEAVTDPGLGGGGAQRVIVDDAVAAAGDGLDAEHALAVTPVVVNQVGYVLERLVEGDVGVALLVATAARGDAGANEEVLAEAERIGLARAGRRPGDAKSIGYGYARLVTAVWTGERARVDAAHGEDQVGQQEAALRETKSRYDTLVEGFRAQQMRRGQVRPNTKYVWTIEDVQDESARQYWELAEEAWGIEVPAPDR